ncbi:MAG: DNA replication/repair protein RecF [Alphaproteobacteria bacterium]
MLTDFRSFSGIVVEPDARPVVLSGPNGAGKTNILEALSLLSPGPGLRRARLGELLRRDAAPDAGWAVAVTVETPQGVFDIGTGQAPGASDSRRVVRIDGRPARGQAALAEAFGVLWLTPAHDRLFVDGAGARRRFLDRLVYGFDPGHARRIAAYERALRERARLLREGPADAVWLDSLEGTMAACGVAVAAGRRATVRDLATVLARGVGPFPGAEVTLDGAVEDWLDAGPAVEAEARFAAALSDARRHDAEAGGARIGPHRSDLAVRHRTKAMPAAQCSTGEQKALLIAMVLAAARLQARRRGAPPLLLLDEVAAHLDEDHRRALFDAIAMIGAQAWLSGTDRALFAAFGDRARFYEVRDSTVMARDHRGDFDAVRR